MCNSTLKRVDQKSLFYISLYKTLAHVAILLGFYYEQKVRFFHLCYIEIKSLRGLLKLWQIEEHDGAEQTGRDIWKVLCRQFRRQNLVLSNPSIGVFVSCLNRIQSDSYKGRQMSQVEKIFYLSSCHESQIHKCHYPCPPNYETLTHFEEWGMTFLDKEEQTDTNKILFCSVLFCGCFSR